MTRKSRGRPDDGPPIPRDVARRMVATAEARGAAARDAGDAELAAAWRRYWRLARYWAER